MNHLQPWLPLSFVLAQYLKKNDIHKQFLTLTERKCFEDVLLSFPTWIAFINQLPNKDSSELETTSFRVRSMLYEQFIPHLFHKHKHCCHTLPLDALLVEARQLIMPSEEEIQQSWSTFLETHTKVKKEEQQPTTPQSNNDDSTQKTTEQTMEEQNQGSFLRERSLE